MLGVLALGAAVAGLCSGFLARYAGAWGAFALPIRKLRWGQVWRCFSSGCRCLPARLSAVPSVFISAGSNGPSRSD